MEKSATFSPCRKYRYTLWRNWGGLFTSGYAMFIGLNPSTADETLDDPTVRRCINYSKNWGYAGLCMTNLFAFRATSPKEMKAQVDPVGPDNDQYLLDMAECAGIIIAAWGINGCHNGRDKEVVRMIGNLHHLGLSKDGHPRHPLYLKNDLKPVLWQA